MRLDMSSELCFLLGKNANDTGSDCMMNDGLVIIANDVDTKFLFEEIVNGRIKKEDSGGGKVGSRETATYNNVASLKFEGLRLSALCAESFAIDKCTIGALHIFDVDL